MLSVVHAEFHSCKESFMLSVIYAERCKKARYDECLYAGCLDPRRGDDSTHGQI
jgi:hypothetical protein